MAFNPNNPFQDDPTQNVPEPDMRQQLMNSLQARMAPVPQPDVNPEESAALMARSGSSIARAGTQLSNALMGRLDSGDNTLSTNLDADAKSQLAAAMEKKRMAAEMDKRREELRNGLSTRFVDDANLKERTDAANAKGDSDYTRNLGDKRLDAEAQRKHELELARINAKNRADLQTQKNDAKGDKPLEPKLLADKDGYDKTISLLNTIKAMKQNTPTGQWANFRNSAAQMGNVDDPQVSNFRSMVGSQLADYIKSISGAAVSDQERAFLLQNVPSLKDSDATFETKLDSLITRMGANRENFLKNLDASGRPNIDKLREVGPQGLTPMTPPPVPTSVEAKKARLEELRAKQKAATGK